MRFTLISYKISYTSNSILSSEVELCFQVFLNLKNIKTLKKNIILREKVIFYSLERLYCKLKLIYFLSYLICFFKSTLRYISF